VKSVESNIILLEPKEFAPIIVDSVNAVNAENFLNHFQDGLTKFFALDSAIIIPLKDMNQFGSRRIVVVNLEHII